MITDVNRAMTSEQYKVLIEGYKKQNPTKYASKQKKFAEKLKELQEAEGVKEEEVKEINN